MKTFEKYLEEDVWEAEGVLDDDMPDTFEAWLEELDTQEVMDYAEDYGKICFKKGINKINVLDIEVIIAKKLPYDGECTKELEDLFNGMSEIEKETLEAYNSINGIE